MSDRPDALMIFAAGFGTRMGALTADRPKPLIEVAGRPLIDHVLRLAGDAGIGRIAANAHYRAEMLARHLAPLDVAVSHEAPEILDTGGGLRQALPMLGAGTVFTANSDAIWTGANPFESLAADWDGEQMGALLLCTEVPGRGDFRLEDRRLQRGGPLTYTGAQIIRADALDGIEDRVFSLNRVWDRLADEGRLYGLIHRGGWCDVGHPAGIAAAEAVLARHDV
ncbi:nucleotidyltransferase family protein [Roseitranquillus sediminis]|uniref:nucleotidyltransferase family protein n=1 Tax=Roseitranquillus sediminis TaxID=2809051 RepID=UPI001D0C034F|nr:nucleotidyltransferase family protein [Roseitranquillus sediminis]MBM9596254.1 nucleotidyltransferase family protein [Roseitranquillus sediminis]